MGNTLSSLATALKAALPTVAAGAAGGLAAGQGRDPLRAAEPVLEGQKEKAKREQALSDETARQTQEYLNTHPWDLASNPELGKEARMGPALIAAVGAQGKSVLQSMLGIDKLEKPEGHGANPMDWADLAKQNAAYEPTLNQLRAMRAQNPQYASFIDAHIAAIEGYQKQNTGYANAQAKLGNPGFSTPQTRDTDARIAETHSRDVSTEEDRKARLGESATAHADAEQARQASQAETVSRDKATEQARRASQAETGLKSLDAERDKLLADFEKLTDAQKPDAKVRVDSHNAAASLFYKKHPGAGAPTLLKWTAGVPSKGFLGGHLPGGRTATAPTIEAVPPMYGESKKLGKSGWRDANGVFYPDQD
jgi:hypothetical protein